MIPKWVNRLRFTRCGDQQSRVFTVSLGVIQTELQPATIREKGLRGGTVRGCRYKP